VGIAVRLLDGYLSRRAQSALGVAVLVYVEPDGSYTLDRTNEPPLSLGLTFSAAQQAIAVLLVRERAERGAPRDHAPRAHEL
jgi:predicted component of type VI protein secretion system